jgi:hypothetical protein
MEQIGRALVVRSGDLTRIYPGGANDNAGAFWMDATGRIGLDDPDEDLTHWHVPGADGMKKVETTITSDEAYDLLQAVIEVGLEEAAIVDVNNPRIR